MVSHMNDAPTHPIEELLSSMYSNYSALSLKGQARRAARELSSRHDVPREHRAQIEAAALGVLTFGEALYQYAYPARGLSPSHDVIIKVCNVVFGEQFFIHVGLKRQVCTETHPLVTQLMQVIFEIVEDQLSAITPASTRRELVVDLLQNTTAVSVFVVRFVAWLVDCEEDQKRKDAQSANRDRKWNT